MRGAVTLIAIASAACGAACRRPPPSLRAAVENQDRNAVIAFKRQWEKGWSDAWVLTRMRVTDIDHFKQGLVLDWSHEEGVEGRRSRHDAFTLDGKFYSAGEEVTERGRLTARAAVYLTDAGIPVYRTVVHLLDGNPAFYDLEAFTGGHLVSTYRSRLNFGVQSRAAGGPATPKLTRVPPDAKLVAGQPSTEVEALRDAQPPH